jgi:hypothetical protein
LIVGILNGLWAGSRHWHYAPACLSFVMAAAGRQIRGDVQNPAPAAAHPLPLGPVSPDVANLRPSHSAVCRSHADFSLGCVHSFLQLCGHLFEAEMHVSAHRLVGGIKALGQNDLIFRGRDLAVRHGKEKVVLFPDVTGLGLHQALQDLDQPSVYSETSPRATATWGGLQLSYKRVFGLPRWTGGGRWALFAGLVAGGKAVCRGGISAPHSPLPGHSVFVLDLPTSVPNARGHRVRLTRHERNRIIWAGCPAHAASEAAARLNVDPR